ncbi:hypothetical protein ACRQ5Q_43640 (plasmid) [Bradyrhizobium sp. PMVTL-01]|uniref:hypothetical protein n=1 Tax=Bradyrhizobium sp. PMVTL-01 TaxID=3434999 RepID=UPI003F6F0B20
MDDRVTCRRSHEQEPHAAGVQGSIAFAAELNLRKYDMRKTISDSLRGCGAASASVSAAFAQGAGGAAGGGGVGAFWMPAS